MQNQVALDTVCSYTKWVIRPSSDTALLPPPSLQDQVAPILVWEEFGHDNILGEWQRAQLVSEREEWEVGMITPSDFPLCLFSLPSLSLFCFSVEDG